VKLRGAAYQHGFFNILRKYIPEFEQQTGMTVDLQLSAFPVYNQQADLELSSGGSAWDFCNVTFILAARWVAAGLLANLSDFSADRKLTPASWNPDDFVKGAQVPYLDKAGKTYGFAWEGGAMLMGISRTDLMKKRGVEAAADLRRTDEGRRGHPRAGRRQRPGHRLRQLQPAPLVPAAVHAGLRRRRVREPARQHHARAGHAAAAMQATDFYSQGCCPSTARKACWATPKTRRARR
jgi:hypothetical protein